MDMIIDINFAGKSLKKALPFFHITEITGRDTLVQKLSTSSLTGYDGDVYFGHKKEAREITVKYVLQAATQYSRRKHRDDLVALLVGQENKRLIFSDDPNRFFLATVSEITPTRITFFCADPYKYSLTEKTVIPSLKFDQTTNRPYRFFQIVNNGNVPCPLRYEINFPSDHDNGYIGLVSQYGAMEFGDINAVDAEWKPTGNKERLNKNDFVSKSTALAGQQHPLKPYSVNGLAKPPKEGFDKWLACICNEYLAGGHIDGWCGGCREFELPNGGCQNVDVEMTHWFQTGAAGQCGEQVIQLLNPNKVVLATFGISKSSSANTAQYYYKVAGRAEPETHDFTPDHTSGNPFGGEGASGHNMIRVLDGKVHFLRLDGQKGERTFALNSTNKNDKVKYIRVFIRHFNGRQEVTRNYIGKLNVVETKVPESHEINNAFARNSRVRISGANGKIHVNNVYKPALEIVGTKYFMARATGRTDVTLHLSDWYEKDWKVDAKVIYRERWL